MKVVSINQPYFAPYPGFFQKALRSDVFVLLDTVQFPRGTTWLSRNRFKNDQGTLWLSVPVWKKGRGLQQIREVEICYEGRWPRKHLASLKTAYARAPFLEDHLEFLETLLGARYETLLEFNLRLLGYLLDTLKISVEVVLLSDLDISLAEPDLSLEVCRRIGATRFLAQAAARKYIHPPGVFEGSGIQVVFFNPSRCVYPQLWGNFLPNLSVLDLLFNCGPAARAVLERGMDRDGT